MSIITTTIKGTGRPYLSNSYYSIRRMLYYWKPTGLEGKVISADVSGYFRTGDDISNKTFNFTLFTNRIDEIDGDNGESWNPSTSQNNIVYHSVNADASTYFLPTTYTYFSNNFLVNSSQVVNLAGGEGDVKVNFTLPIPSENQDTSKWNNKNVFLGIYQPDNSYGTGYDLIWGGETGHYWDITLTCQVGSTLKYYTSGSWKDVNELYYYTNGDWQRVNEILIRKDSNWKS